MITPPALKQGDKVAIISPSGIIVPERVDGAVATLKKWGFVPVLGKNVLKSYRAHGAITYGGTDEERLADLLWALTTPDIKCIFCSRGGYGTVHLLEAITPELIRVNAKWLVGFSDICALHAAWHQAGVMSLHASMAKQLTDYGTEGEVNEAMHAFLTGENIPIYNEPVHPFNRVGEASGKLVGGNLAVLSALVGTPYNLLQPDSILFLEDVGEEMYRVERLLYQLRLAGILPQLKGLIVGQFTRYHLNGELMDTEHDSEKHMYRLIADMVAPYGYPVAFNFPIGHVDRNVPLLEGAPVTLNVTSKATTLHF